MTNANHAVSFPYKERLSRYVSFISHESIHLSSEARDEVENFRRGISNIDEGMVVFITLTEVYNRVKSEREMKLQLSASERAQVSDAEINHLGDNGIGYQMPLRIDQGERMKIFVQDGVLKASLISLNARAAD